MPNFNVFLDFQEGQLVTTCIYRLYWYPSYVTSNVKNNLQVLSPWSPKTHSRSRSWNNWANSSAWWLAGRNWPGHPPPSFPQHRVDWLKFRVPTFRNLSACWLEVYWLNFRVPTFRNLSDCWLEVYWLNFRVPIFRNLSACWLEVYWLNFRVPTFRNTFSACWLEVDWLRTNWTDRPFREIFPSLTIRLWVTEWWI